MRPAFKPILVVGAVVVAMAGFSYWRAAGEADHADGVPWRSSLSAAKAEAAKSEKPVLIYFTASWCGPCRDMKASTWPDARVHAALEDFVPVKVDVDDLPDLAQEFGVSGIPRMQVLKPDGTRGEAAAGAMSPEQIIRWLRGARKA